MENTKPPPYAYSEELLKEKMEDCETLEELIEYCAFLQDMADQNLITMTFRLKLFANVKQHELINKEKFL